MPVIGVSKRVEGLGIKDFEEIMSEKFSNLMKTIYLQIQESQWSISRWKMNSTPRHILIKLIKISAKEKNLLKELE